ILTLVREETDPYISITSRADEQGNLADYVGRIDPKFKEFQKRGGDTVITSHSQSLVGLNDKGLEIYKLRFLLEAARMFADRGQEKRRYLESIHQKYENIALAGSGQVKIRDLYVKIPILEIVRMEGSEARSHSKKKLNIHLPRRHGNIRGWEETLWSGR